jgi:putative transposase
MLPRRRVTILSTTPCRRFGCSPTPNTATTILKEAGVNPAPERAASTWADFLRSQADALLACDFLETVTLTGARMYVFAVIEHANRQIRILGATAHPTASWVAQAAKNLIMDLDDARCHARFMIRDRTARSPSGSTPSPPTRASTSYRAASRCRE